MERVVLVLSGGGLKGLAHVGALRALEESGLRPSAIVGTSIGALVGACVAGGRAVSEVEAQARELTRPDIVGLNRWAFLLNGIRQPSVFRAEPFQEYIARTLPVQSFHELGVPLEVNAVDLETGEEEWFGPSGRMDVSLSTAVYASGALPLFYPPAEIGGRYFVDGGVMDSLPLRRAEAYSPDRIVAVDAGAGRVRDSLDTLSQGMVAVHHRVYDIMNFARKQDQLDHWTGSPLLYVRPHLEGHSTFDFGSLDYFLEEGYRATREALSTAVQA